MITLDYLKSLDACPPAVDWFSSEFPEGAETKDALAACQRDDWVCWFACRVSENYRWWCAGKAFEWAALRHPTLRQWANNVNADNWRAAAYAATSAHAADAAAYDAADAAADAADAAADAAAADAADAAAAYFRTRKSAYSVLRAEAERVLLDAAGR